jgi:sugar lactone lactonase YvrE
VSLLLLPILLIAFDSRGQNLFSSDGGTIYEYTPGGTSRSVFATAPGNAETIAFDQAGNLFVPNTSTGTITEIARNGTQTTFASGLTTPSALAFDNAGNLYASDTATDTIYKYTPGGVRSTFATGVSTPYGMAVNSAGNLFVVANGVIYQFNTSGVRSTFATVTGQFVGGLAFNSAGELFATVGGDAGSIYEYLPNGNRTIFASGLINPLNLAFDSAGDLFVSDFAANPITPDYIYEYTPGGQRIGFDNDVGAIGLAVQPAPEPSAIWLLAAGGMVILLVRRAGFYRS